MGAQFSDAAGGICCSNARKNRELEEQRRQRDESKKKGRKSKTRKSIAFAVEKEKSWFGARGADEQETTGFIGTTKSTPGAIKSAISKHEVAAEDSDGSQEPKSATSLRTLMSAVARLEEIDKLQSCISGTAKKKAINSKLFGSTKERYLAVLPGPQDHQADRIGEPVEVSTCRRWRTGVLGYWESKADYDRRSMPKGTIPLLSITQVLNSGGKTAVDVTYEDSETHVTKCLDLTFDTPNRADEWKKALEKLKWYAVHAF